MVDQKIHYSRGSLLFYAEIVLILGVQSAGYTDEKFIWFLSSSEGEDKILVEFSLIDNKPSLLVTYDNVTSIQKEIAIDTLFTLVGCAVHHSVSVEFELNDSDTYFGEE